MYDPGKEVIKRFKKKALTSYYFIWVIFLGAGLFAGIKIFPCIKLPRYSIYILIVIIYILLAAALSIYILLTKRTGKLSGSMSVLLLVIIPSSVFFICGYIIPSNNAIYDLTVTEENHACRTVMVQVQGRVNEHPRLLYGSTHFSIKTGLSDNPLIRTGDCLGVKVKGPLTHEMHRDSLVNIKGELKVRDNDITLHASGDDIQYPDGRGFSACIYGLRHRIFYCISQSFACYLDYEQAALARALVLGDRTGISVSQYDAFRRSGTAHLIAISGMHISFLAAIIYVVLKRICKKPLLIFLIIMILLLYNFVIGPGASTVRATLWIIGAASAEGWKREFRPAYIFCLSFILMVLFNPSFLGNPGFWMSFSAMAGIIFVYPVALQMVKAVGIPTRITGNHITGSMLVTLSIQLACGPLLLYFFHSIPLASPLSNLVILPFFYILILLLFLAAGTSILWPPAAGAVLKLTPVFFRAVNKISVFFSHPRFSGLEAEGFPQGYMAVYYIALFLILLWARLILCKRFDF